MKTNDTSIAGRPLLRWIVLLTILLCSAVAIMIDSFGMQIGSDMDKGLLHLTESLDYETSGIEIEDAMFAVVLFFLFNRFFLRKESPFSRSAFFTSCFLAFFLLLGISFSRFHSFAFLCSSRAQTLIAFGTFVGLWAILYLVLKLLFRMLDSGPGKINFPYSFPARVSAFVSRHFFLFSFLVMLLFWLPIELAFFPGSLHYDGCKQVEMFLGFQTLTTHHPYISTLLIGACYRLGETLFGRNYAILPYVVLQNMVSLAVFSSICSFIRDKASVFAGLLCLAFFSLVPAFPTFSQAVLKDGLYTAFFAWYVLNCVRIYMKDGSPFPTWTSLILSGGMVCLLRNNGAYIVLPSLFLLIFMVKGKKKAVVLSFVSVLAIHVGINGVLVNSLQIQPGPKVEMLCLPIQQIARYVTYYEDEFTEDEQRVIDRVIRYAGIPERYNPENADPVKMFYRSTTPEEWRDFEALWLDKLTDRPLIYAEASVNHMFGYLDPFYFYSDLSVYPLYNQEPSEDKDISGSLAVYATEAHTRQIASAYVYMWQKVPVLSFFVNPAFYTWLCVILLAALLRKRLWSRALLFIVPLLNICICFLSPVNGYLRYMFPVIAAMPLYVLLGLQPYWEKPTASPPYGEHPCL